MVKLEHKAGPTIIRELALRLYPSPLESFREAIANAFDEGSNKVDIICSNNEIIVEDWGEGIEDVEKFRMYGQDTKASLGGEIIVEKGLGKLALLRLKNEVEFRTNNGEVGIYFIMSIEGFDPPQYRAVNKFLDHQGTQIIIKNPDVAPPTDELAEYLKKVFGLRIAGGREIIVNGAKLTSTIDAKEELLFRLKGADNITGNLKQDKTGKGSVDLYVKHIYIRPITVDPERSFKGWVNCNSLTPTTNRNDVLTDDDVYQEFIDHLRQVVARRFPRREEELNKTEVLLANELSKMLRLYLKHMNIMPKGNLPFGRGQEPFLNARQRREHQRKNRRIEKPEPHEEKELKAKLRTNNPINRTRRTELGFQEVWTKEGNEKEPYYFCEPNLTIYNTTNDLYKFAMKNKPQLGPKYLRFLPWLVRVGVSMNPESKKWDRDKYNLALDQAARYYLTQRGEIS